MIGSLENGAKTVQYVSELYAYIFTIPIFKCLVDFCGIFYIVKVAFLCLQENIFGQIWLRGFSLQWFCIVQIFKIFM